MVISWPTHQIQTEPEKKAGFDQKLAPDPDCRQKCGKKFHAGAPVVLNM